MNSIGWAVIMLREGEKITRAGWNGKDMYLVLVHRWTGMVGNMPPDYEMLPFVAMKTADNKVVPWLCSQTDLLATDWMLYSSKPAS